MELIIGIALMAGAVGLFFGYIFQSNKLTQIKATETAQAKDLQELAASVAADIGAGSFNEISEVKGKAKCDSPLTSELAKIKCVYYSMRVTREYEETYWDTDANGNRVQNTRQGSDTVANNTRSVPFYLQDASGKIKINPESASFFAEKAFSRFEPGEVHGSSIRIGGLTINLGGLSLGANRRTIGYRYEEEIIPLGRDLYILGEASDSSGVLCIQRPSDKKKKFIISVKSEEELVKSAARAIKWFLIGSMITGVGGLTVLILALLGYLKL